MCEKEQPKVGPKGEGMGTTESNDMPKHCPASLSVYIRAKLAMRFQIPSQARLARDSETPSLILLRKWPCIYLCIKMKTSG